MSVSMKNREVMIDIKDSIQKLTNDVVSIKRDLKDIKSYISQQNIDDDKLKKGENLAAQEKGWFKYNPFFGY